MSSVFIYMYEVLIDRVSKFCQQG